MEEKYVALAIPFFFVMIAIELAFSRRAAEPRYSFQDSITCLSCGIGQQVLEPFLRTAGLFAYVALFAHARLATVSATSIGAWVFLLFAVDLAYYAFHRASHRVNVLWASHVVHHQSEEYNLSVALRQSWIEILIQPLFYLPLAVIGFPPAMFVAMSTLNTLYQFWIHTRAVKKLGWLESFLNTPSHHRVHHGVNPKYIDKNYGGIFIVWDRLFGTFQEEEEEPVYGTVKPLASWNPLWANAEYWFEIAAMARATSRFADRVKVWFMPPEWRPADLSGGLGYVTIPEASRATQTKYRRAVPMGLSVYVAVSFVLVATATTLFLWFAEVAPPAALVAASALILTTLLAWGALFEAKPWAVALEVARLAAIVVVVAWLARGADGYRAIVGVTAVGAVALAAWVLRYRGNSAVNRVQPSCTVEGAGGGATAP
jgi:sterol desaturase/sphingolipid hydroxylase (fatty acid hydroxylase superfamily)